jgi:hypothetical protein
MPDARKSQQPARLDDPVTGSFTPDCNAARSAASIRHTTPWGAGVPADPGPPGTEREPLVALDGYVIEGELGRGGMGEVYRAHDVVLNRALAVKVLWSELQGNEPLDRRFRDEARTTTVERASRYWRLGGKGRDAGALDAKEKARLRRLALDWLTAELGGLREQRRTGARKIDEIMRILRSWQQADDLIGVRAPGELAQIPVAERQCWQKLWADVASLLQHEGRDQLDHESDRLKK